MHFYDRFRSRWIRKKKAKGAFSFVCPNWDISIDKHDKLIEISKQHVPLTV